MSLKHVLYLVVSLLLTAAIAFAQQPTTPPAWGPGEPLELSLMDGGGFLGVHTEDINKENLGSYGMSEVRGVGITEVVKDSPAEKAGLRKGDVIVSFENEAVTSARKLSRLVSEVAPDHTVSLRIRRGGSEQQVSVTIGKRSNISANTLHGLLNQGPNNWNWAFPDQDKDGPFVYSLGSNRRIGVSTTALTKQLADFFGIADGKGVLVTSVDPDSPAAKAGLKAGDVITAIDGEKVEGPGDLARGVNKQKDGEVTVTIVRDKSTRTVKVTPEKREAQQIQAGRTSAAVRDQIRDAVRRGAAQGRIVIPRIELPSIPPINVTVPQIDLPTIPEIDVVVPITPKVKVIRAPKQPI